ncbi:MAG: hypothetical protein R2778_17015 [Saprospiraceae bacterium]
MRLLSILLLLFISTALTAQKTTPNRTFDLKDALEQKLISLDVEGIGGHQGESLKLLIKTLLADILGKGSAWTADGAFGLGPANAGCR